MPIRNHAIFWSFAFLAIIGFLFLFQSVLTPFVLGFLIAYFLNPSVNGLSRLGVSRGPAAILMTAVFACIVGTFMALLMPVLYKQMVELSQDTPGYIESISAWIEPYTGKALALLGEENGQELQALLTQQASNAAQVSSAVVPNL